MRLTLDINDVELQQDIKELIKQSLLTITREEVRAIQIEEINRLASNINTGALLDKVVTDKLKDYLNESSYLKSKTEFLEFLKDIIRQVLLEHTVEVTKVVINANQ